MLHNLECNLTYANDNIYASATGFYNIIANSILRSTWFGTAYTDNDVGSDFDQNLESTNKAVGFEAEIQYAPNAKS